MSRPLQVLMLSLSLESRKDGPPRSARSSEGHPVLDNCQEVTLHPGPQILLKSNSSQKTSSPQRITDTTAFPMLSPVGFRLGQPKKRCDMGDCRDWVVGSFSKRICWVPLEYTRPDHPSYCWVGYTLVMAGQDSMLRVLPLKD